MLKLALFHGKTLLETKTTKVYLGESQPRSDFNLVPPLIYIQRGLIQYWISDS